MRWLWGVRWLVRSAAGIGVRRYRAIQIVAAITRAAKEVHAAEFRAQTAREVACETTKETTASRM